MIKARNGDVWFAGYSGLTRIHNGQFTRRTERDGLPSDNVSSIYEDLKGVFWIGTYDGGLGRYSDGRWTRYTQKNGLFDNGVFQTLEDSRGNLWMSSNRGIYQVSKQQLNDVAAGKRKDVITVSYGRADGMLNSECNGGLWPAGAKDIRDKERRKDPWCDPRRLARIFAAVMCSHGNLAWYQSRFCKALASIRCDVARGGPSRVANSVEEYKRVWKLPVDG